MIEETLDFIGKNSKIFIPLSISFIGFTVLVFQLTILRKAKQSKFWKTINGTITSSTIDTRETLIENTYTKSYKSTIQYKYTINEQEYTGKKIYWGDNIFANSKEKVEKYARKYPKGSKIIVYYNPFKNNKSVLEPGIKLNLLIIAGLAVLLIIFGLSCINNPIFELYIS